MIIINLSWSLFTLLFYLNNIIDHGKEKQQI